MFRFLDLFCGAGGAAMGYHHALKEAGIEHEITGIDINPMPRYPFRFIQADALEYLWDYGEEYDFIHASPPCQKYSLGSSRWDKEYPDLLNTIEVRLAKGTKNFAIENVERAPFLLSTFTLCGIQFGLNVIRHRKFAVNFFFLNRPHAIPHPPRGKFVTCAGHGGNGSNSFSVWCDAMKIDWMNKEELSEAIPPDYTKFIMQQYLSSRKL
jgi:DNA (cytosine-5)-methyltransferase 1